MRHQKSFTVIELLIVIAMIGLVASIILVQVQGAREKARIASALDFSHTLQNTLGLGAVGIWRFDGNSKDTSGYGNNGTIHGDAGFTSDTPHNVVGSREGKYALSFDGLDDYVEVPDSSPLNVGSITIEIWVKQTSKHPTTWTYLLSKGGWGSYHIISEDVWSNNQIGFTVLVGGTSYRLWTLKALELGKWTHLTFTYDSVTGLQRNYWNGSLDTEASRTPGNIDINTSPLRITGAKSAYFNGLIDEVRIYTQALTSAQIKKHYTRGTEKYGKDKI